MYIVLPFGWTLSPYFWGAVAKVPVTEMRTAGIPTIMYVDDGLNGGRTLADALKSRDVVESTLERYGIPQERDAKGWPVKGSWTPVRRVEHLGEYLLLPENRFPLWLGLYEGPWTRQPWERLRRDQIAEWGRERRK